MQSSTIKASSINVLKNETKKSIILFERGMKMNNIFEDTKYLIKKYNVKANKSLGQNFLINQDVVNKIIESSNINKDDLVIEIGPGLGTLT